MEAIAPKESPYPAEVVDLINNHHRAIETPFLFLDKLEIDGTRLFANKDRIRTWMLMGNGSVEAAKRAGPTKLLDRIEVIEALVSPLVGYEIGAAANQVCRVSSEGTWEETQEEYSPEYVNGKVEGVQAMVVELTDNYPKGFGDHVPGSYPKEGRFEHYRICLSLGEVALPISQFDGGWNALRLAENAKLL